MRKVWVMLIGLAISSAGSAEDLKIVDQGQFDRLWQVASERMSPVMPPLAMETTPLISEHGKIWVDREFAVDAKGKPSDYKLHSIEPAGVDPRPFIAMEMFLRYRPIDGVAATPVRVRGRQIFHTPRDPTAVDD